MSCEYILKQLSFGSKKLSASCSEAERTQDTAIYTPLNLQLEKPELDLQKRMNHMQQIKHFPIHNVYFLTQDIFAVIIF